MTCPMIAHIVKSSFLGELLVKKSNGFKEMEIFRGEKVKVGFLESSGGLHVLANKDFLTY